MLRRVGLVVPSARDVPSEEEHCGSASDVNADYCGIAVLGSCLEGVWPVLDVLDVKVGLEERVVVWEPVGRSFRDQIPDFSERRFCERPPSTAGIQHQCAAFEKVVSQFFLLLWREREGIVSGTVEHGDCFGVCWDLAVG